MRRIEMRYVVAVALAVMSSSSAAAGPRDPHTPSALRIAITEGRVCALLEDGSVRCWGDNSNGELGDGTTTERHTPVTVKGVSNAVDLALSLSGACARLADKTVTCWGESSFLEVGTTPGGSTPNTPHPVAALAKATALWFSATGDGCARWDDNTKKCWGSGGGYLAVGKPGDYGTAPLPVIPALAGATQIAVSESLGCARMADATVKCWGVNEYGQVGDGTTQTQLAPVAVRALVDVDQVVVGRDSACALIKGGTVRCWGNNHAGQLGDGTTTPHKNPVDVKGVRGATSIVAGELHACAIVEHGRLTCWGFNRAGQLGNGAHGQEQSGPVSVSGLEGVRQVALAFSHSCAIVDTGDVYCWGQGWRGVIGDGLQADRDVPTKVRWSLDAPKDSPLPASVHVTSVAISGIHTCASLDNGTVRCWGRNDGGIVDTRGARQSFERPVIVPGVDHAATVAVDLFDSYARLADGGVVTWGRGKAVQKLSIAPVRDFVEGDGATCVLRDDAATCHLFGASGKTSVANAAKVVASSLFACAVMKDGTAQCAGVNNHGQLGDGTTTERDSFVKVKGVTGIAQLAIGDFQACARITDGTVTCWGDVAMTGMGNAIQTAPSAVRGLANVVDLVAGPSSVCARHKDGHVSCWGAFRPVSGNRDDWYSDLPRVMPWLAGAKMLALGRNHSCAVTAAGALACWGENEAGQLGDGTMDARHEPALVRW